MSIKVKILKFTYLRCDFVCLILHSIRLLYSIVCCTIYCLFLSVNQLQFYSLLLPPTLSRNTLFSFITLVVLFVQFSHKVLIMLIYMTSSVSIVVCRVTCHQVSSTASRNVSPTSTRHHRTSAEG